jgi:hypothetical protein
MLPHAKTATTVGFSVASLATRAGFGIAQASMTVASGCCVIAGAGLASAGMVTAGPAVAAAGGAIYLANRAVGLTSDVTLATQDAARLVTLSSIDVAQQGTEAAGYIDGDGVRVFLNEDDVGAITFIRQMVTRFLAELPPSTTLPSLYADLGTLAQIHRDCRVGDPTAMTLPEVPVDDDAIRYVRWAVAIYGKRPTAFLGINRNGSGASGDRMDGGDAVSDEDDCDGDEDAMPGVDQQPPRPKSLDSFCAITSSLPSSILSYDLKGATYAPGHIVALDEANKKVVVVLRGTINFPSDVFTDLVCGVAYMDNGNTGAHSGMLEAAKRVSATIAPVVARTVSERPGWEVVVTGHSLGAGVASLLTVLWGETIAGAKITCHAYAPPCTLTLDRARSVRNVHSVVCANDVVSRFGLNTMVDLREAAVSLQRDRLEEGDDEGGFGDVTSEEKLKFLRENVMTEGPKLHPVGSITWLSTQEKGGVAYRADNGEFDTIALTEGMYKNHMPQVYLREVEAMAGNGVVI